MHRAIQQTLAAFTIALGLGTLHAADAPAKQKKSKPNILVILTDDLGYDDVHNMNPERGKIATPNLDKFPGEGMAFSEAHASSSVCTPTRFSLLTGRHNWRSRLHRGVLRLDDPPLIAADRLTLP